MTLILTALFRELARHPWQLLLTLFSIAAGVAIVVGVDVANQTALKEFERANRVVNGVATHRIVGTDGIDQDIYRKVKVEARIRDATPVISARVRLEGDDQPRELLGIDPLSDYRIRRLLPGPGDQDRRFGSSQWPLFVGSDIGEQTGDGVTLVSGSRQQTFHIVGTLDQHQEQATRATGLLVTDIAWAQHFLKKQGKLDYVDLRLPANHDIAKLEAILPDTVQLLDLNLYNNARQAMTRAFRVNLAALSLLALVIAMFLVYSTMSFQVARRARLFAMLRGAGASGRQIVLALAMEVLVIAMVGTLVGMAAGVVLAIGLAGLVTDTINSLYYELAQSRLALSSWTVTKGLAIGIGATFLACAVPISGVLRSSIRGLLLRSRQEQVARGLARWSEALSVLLAAIGLACLLWSRQSLAVSFLGLFLVILSLASLAPGLIGRSSAWVGARQFRGNWINVKMAVMNIRAHLSRTAVAVAALTVAVSATLGVGLMIDSFRFSVERWMESYLRADIYITSSAIPSRIAPDVLAELADMEGVQNISFGTRRTVQGQSGPITLFALNTPQQGFAGFQVIESGEPNLWSAYHEKGEVLISEPLSRRLGIGTGDRVQLATDRGTRSFPVAAVYTDYSTDQGLVTMDWNTYRKFYNSDRVASAALYLGPGVDDQAIIARIQGRGFSGQGLSARSNLALRQAGLSVFDQTFRITGVLRWLALIVAAVGIISALMALQLDRAREYAILKAIGYTPRQLSAQMILETGLTGLWAGILSVPMGLFLALVLIEVINVRSFGWSMETVVDGFLIIQAVLLAVIAAALAGLYPAWRLHKSDIASGLRNE